MRGTRATWVLADLAHSQDDMVVRLEARVFPRARDPEDMLDSVNAFVGGVAGLTQVASSAALPTSSVIWSMSEHWRAWKPRGLAAAWEDARV